MTWIWTLFALLLVAAGLRYVLRLRSARPPGGPPVVDDDALRRILEEGTLTTEEEEPLDLDEIARAEEDFWAESWDEPEEHPR